MYTVTLAFAVAFIFKYLVGGGVMYVHAGAWRGQKRASDFLGLELRAVVSSVMWVLEAKLPASAKAVLCLTTEPFIAPGQPLQLWGVTANPSWIPWKGTHSVVTAGSAHSVLVFFFLVSQTWTSSTQEALQLLWLTSLVCEAAGT